MFDKYRPFHVLQLLYCLCPTVSTDPLFSPIFNIFLIQVPGYVSVIDYSIYRHVLKALYKSAVLLSVSVYTTQVLHSD